MICSNCAEPGASVTCPECKIEDVGCIKTWYCSEHCRSEDKPNHELICDNRQKLGRAVVILSEIWDSFCRKTFMSRYRLDRVDGSTIHLSRQKELAETSALMGHPIFQQFPEDIMTQDAGLAAEQAVLYHNMCVDSLSTGLPLIKALLEPICHSLKEISVWPKHSPMKVVYNNETDEVDHAVLYTRLHSGEEFVIDLTGAQYGWKEKLYIWKEFVEYRGTIRYVLDLGAARAFTTSLMQGHAINSAPRSACDIRRLICQEVAQSITNSLQDYDQTADQLMGLDLDQQRDLIMRANETITKSIEDLVIRSGVGRMCLLFEGGISTPVVVRSEELARKLASVWFTQEEVQACQGQSEALQLEMQHRLYEGEV